MKIDWESIAIVLIVACSLAYCTVKRRDNAAASIECAKIGGIYTDDHCVKVKP